MVVINNHCGYLMRTKVSSSDEGGVAAGFAVLDSLYLTEKVLCNSIQSHYFSLDTRNFSER